MNTGRGDDQGAEDAISEDYLVGGGGAVDHQ